MPYSIDEIYAIKSSGKYNGLAPVYHEFYHIYEEYTHNLYARGTITPDVVITEDSNAGYDFFQAATSHIKCISAGGNGNVFNTALTIRDQSILIIADGAAFGAHMERICQLLRSGADLHLFLPESFEWLILDSGIINDIPRIKIDNAENYADSTKYFSWEQYFTELITKYTKDTHMAYRKDHLNDYYKHPSIVRKILDNIRGINFNKSED